MLKATAADVNKFRGGGSNMARHIILKTKVKYKGVPVNTI